jgi:hypothetical protein
MPFPENAMQPLPAAELRHNVATWAVPLARLPAAAAALTETLPAERFDPSFRGQRLDTTYFDTARFALRKARQRGKRYLTLRLRRYRPEGAAPTFAVSAKTEETKVRREIDAATAARWLGGVTADEAGRLLPPDLFAHLLDLASDEPLVPVTCVYACRYAVEDDQDRLTLDADVHTDAGKRLPYAVLEFKSNRPDAETADAIARLGLRPLKISKFLWATEV